MERSIQELVQMAKDGNQEASSELYSRTYNSVYQSVKVLIKDEYTALDIVQDAYIKGFDNLNKLSSPEKYQAWMKTLASNLAKDYLRKRRPELFSERTYENGEQIDANMPDDCLEHLPDELLDREETVRLMKEIIDTLSEDQRAVIFMRFYEEMSLKEIAEALNCSENTVKSRLRYALNKVKVKVQDLAEQGTKLYSLSPISFFTWLLRMAKQQGISFALDAVDTSVAAGTAAGAAVASETTAAGAAVAGETTAATTGVSASVNAAAGATVKAAGTAAGKTVATKVVAGTLAATMTIGTGAVVANNISKEKQNEAAHIIYEEFLGRYQDAFEMDGETFLLDYNRFWDEISEDIINQNPDIDLTVTNSWYLEYTPGEDFDEGIPVPDTLYEPNMDSRKLLQWKIEGEEICYAYNDTDGNGVDELFVMMNYRNGLHESLLDVYVVDEDKLLRGKAVGKRDGDYITWELAAAEEAEYVAPGVVYINLGNGYFDEPISIGKPFWDWQTLCSW